MFWVKMEKNVQFERQDYWDDRFATETEFEWLSGFEQFSNVVLPHIQKEDRIAHIGCGTSRLSAELVALGYTDVTNVDFSEVLVERGRREFPDMKWVVDDITTLSHLPDGHFDVVIEKATLESVVVGERSPWEPSDDALRKLESIFSSICRVLKPNGVFISISFVQPHFRVPALARERRWSIQVFRVGADFHFFVYVCRVGGVSDENAIGPLLKLAPSWSRAL